MKSITNGIILTVCLVLLAPAWGIVGELYAGMKPAKTTDELQRQAQVFDLLPNSVSNVAFSVSNYGILGRDLASFDGGVYWPRTSDNRYLYGAGLWFGAVKRIGADETPRPLVTISYNPNSGLSWLAPGRIEDGDNVLHDQEAVAYARVYSSSAYNADGQPQNPVEDPAWPLWYKQADRLAHHGRYFGSYVADKESRSTADWPEGPGFISDEDFIAYFKDTDLSLYEDSPDELKQRGHPLRMQYEQAVYSWGSGPLQDVIMVRYKVSNTSSDILENCWLAPVFDIDHTTRDIGRDGSDNDRVRYYYEDPLLNLALSWTEGFQGESGKGFGYMGISILESPAVDATGRLRGDKQEYDRSEQLGLAAFRNWQIQNDPTDDSERYQFMAAAQMDSDFGAGDKRMLLSSGPFDLQPGESASLVYALVFADAATDEGKTTVPTGSKDDLLNLVNLVRTVQDYYDARLTGVAMQRAMLPSLQLELRPNPASDAATLHIGNSPGGFAHITLVDVLGRIVQRMTPSPLDAGNSVLPLTLDGLAPGMYQLRVQLGEIETVTTLAVQR